MDLFQSSWKFVFFLFFIFFSFFTRIFATCQYQGRWYVNAILQILSSRKNGSHLCDTSKSTRDKNSLSKLRASLLFRSSLVSATRSFLNSTPTCYYPVRDQGRALIRAFLYNYIRTRILTRRIIWPCP